MAAGYDKRSAHVCSSQRTHTKTGNKKIYIMQRLCNRSLTTPFPRSRLFPNPDACRAPPSPTLALGARNSPGFPEAQRTKHTVEVKKERRSTDEYESQRSRLRYLSSLISPFPLFYPLTRAETHRQQRHIAWRFTAILTYDLLTSIAVNQGRGTRSK
jgi:hypothetical protein